MAETAAASSQVQLDIGYEAARKAAGKTVLADLAVNDTALLFPRFCLEGEELAIPNTDMPTDLAGSSYTPPAVLLRITMLPGHRVKAVLVDGQQAKAVANGNSNAAPVLSDANFRKEVRELIERLFDGDVVFGNPACSALKTSDALKDFAAYPVDSINGFHKISDLANSVAP